MTGLNFHNKSQRPSDWKCKSLPIEPKGIHKWNGSEIAEPFFHLPLQSYNSKWKKSILFIQNEKIHLTTVKDMNFHATKILTSEHTKGKKSGI